MITRIIDGDRMMDENNTPYIRKFTGTFSFVLCADRTKLDSISKTVLTSFKEYIEDAICDNEIAISNVDVNIRETTRKDVPDELKIISANLTASELNAAFSELIREILDGDEFNEWTVNWVDGNWIAEIAEEWSEDIKRDDFIELLTTYPHHLEKVKDFIERKRMHQTESS